MEEVDLEIEQLKCSPLRAVLKNPQGAEEAQRGDLMLDDEV